MTPFKNCSNISPVMSPISGGVARVKVFEERIEPAFVTDKRAFRVLPFEAVQIRFNGGAQGDPSKLPACQRIEKIFTQPLFAAGVGHEVKERKFLFSVGAICYLR